MADRGDGPELIGVPRARPDSREKVTGATRYAADRPLNGLLHGRLVRSIYAHAWIRRIDTEGALALPGVVAVLTAADLRIVEREDMRMYEPLAREEALFAGQPVALVVAQTPEAARDGVELIEVDYEPLPVVVDLAAAMLPDSPPTRLTKLVEESTDETGADARATHAAVGAKGAEFEQEEDLSVNVVNRKRYARASVAEALAGSAAVVDGTFRTNWVYQAYLEPHSATAWLETDGTLVVEASTQGTFYTRRQLARMYGLPMSKVRVTGTPLGGAFGSKLMIVEPIVVGAALALGAPVRLVLDRLEDISATNPAPGSTAEVTIGAAADGRFTGLDARLVFDTGAYTEWAIEGVGAILIAGPYRWDAFDVKAYGVRTNRFGTGSYRAPGAPQAAFVIESLIDQLAVQLSIDPLEIRLRNLAPEAEPMVDGEPWPPLGHRAVLEAVADSEAWRERSSVPADEGVGLALAYWPGAKEPAAAACRLNGDGSLTVVTGVVDMSGTTGGLALIAAATFGVPVEAVNVVSLDTAAAPVAPISGGSVITYAAGEAVRSAALEARQQLLEFAAREFEIDPADLEIVDGAIRPRGTPDRARPVRDFAAELADFGAPFPPVEGHASRVHKSLAPSTAAHVARVRLDRDTGQVELRRLLVVQDVGRALNPALVEGQMRGGATQGVGWALHEELVHDEQGQLVSGSFMDYALPRATDVPAIETRIVEVPAPDGPFGAKGIGEAPVVPAAAAVANAIAAAGGPRLRELPMTPRRVWHALHARLETPDRGDGQ